MAIYVMNVNEQVALPLVQYVYSAHAHSQSTHIVCL